jgi:hypothetical protein
VTAVIGTVTSGASVNLTIVARPTAIGTITDNLAGRSPVTDLNLSNNVGSVKTVVIAQPALLQTVALGGAQLTLSWPEEASNFVLESTTNFTPPVVWSAVTNSPVINGSLRTVILTVDPAAPTKFFRLRQTP